MATRNMKETETTKYRRRVGRWRCATFVLLTLCIVLVIALVVVIILKDKMFNKMMVPPCTGQTESINLEIPDEPSVFNDLTPKEINKLLQYLYSQPSLNLVDPSEAAVNNSYVFMTDLHLPNKQDVLRYLDDGGTKPPREAKVVIFRGDKRDPDIEEYIVGPLSNPESHRHLDRKRSTPIPFRYRPITGPEIINVINKISLDADEALGPMLKEKFGSTFTNCGDSCLSFRFLTSMSKVVTGENSRKLWFWANHFVEFYVLNPIDFSVLVRLDNKTIVVEKVWHKKAYESFANLRSQYDNGFVKTANMPFPKVDKNYFSTLNQRGTRVPEHPTRNPIQIEPDGKRYSIQGRHVSYMGWEFDFRMAVASGPQLFDIKFRKERIAYELSLQEIAVFYSGHSPTQKFADYIDSISLIGASARGLIPGSDCPEGATFIDLEYFMESSRKPSKSYSAFCLFEFNTGVPLRRHQAYTIFSGHYYEGMADVVLILRTMVTIANYDYLFDFIFHQNGAIEVRGISTGFILSQVYSDEESPYGAQLNQFITGSIHHHMFNFKADLDIKGTNNCFETLDIVPQSVPNNMWSINRNAEYHQTKFEHNRKITEREGAYTFNFDVPKYLILFNDNSKRIYGNTPGYRILLQGMSKQVIAEGQGNEPAVSWARYQMAVTKQKDDERESSSIYALWDSDDPVIQFQNFIDDDESIIDQDLVAWISMGVHHIPHTEDLPVTPTPGMALSFFLLPYNYFEEDPAMASGNAIRIDWGKKESVSGSDAKPKIRIERYGVPSDARCVAPSRNYEEMVKKNPSMVLEDHDSVVGVF